MVLGTGTADSDACDTQAIPWLLIVILAFAFLVRIAGIQFGLPALYHADEPIVVNHAVAYGTGDLNPHFFKIPPLLSYLLFGTYGLYYFAGRLLDWFEGLEEFGRLFVTDPSSFYLLGRVIFGCIFGTATVVALYRLASRHFSKRHGLAAAFFLAACFLHVRDSHYIYADIPLLFVLVLCFFPIFAISTSGRIKSYVLFGILSGICTAAKYNGCFIFVPFIAAHWYRCRKTREKIFGAELFLTFLVSAVFFVLLNPFSVMDFRFFFNEIMTQAKAESAVGWMHHLTYSLAGGLGIPILVLAVLGLFRSCFLRERKRWIILSFIFVYYAVLCGMSQPYDRYVLPLIPFLVLFAADTLITVVDRFKLSPAAIFFLAIGLAIPPLVKIYWSNRLFLRADVRDLGRAWAEVNIPAGSKIALDTAFFAPRLKRTVQQLTEKKEMMLQNDHFGKAQLKRIQWLLAEAQADSGRRFNLYSLGEESGFLFSAPSVPFDVEALRAAGINYVIRARFDRLHRQGFYRDLERVGKRIARFSPYKDAGRDWPIDQYPLTGAPFTWAELAGRERNGHVIEIYRLNRSGHEPVYG